MSKAHAALPNIAPSPATHGFTRSTTHGLQKWVRSDHQVAINHYAAIKGVRRGVFYVYRAVGKVPAGRCPTSVNNRRVGQPSGEPLGFATLREAMNCAEAA